MKYEHKLYTGNERAHLRRFLARSLTERLEHIVSCACWVTCGSGAQQRGEINSTKLLQKPAALRVKIMSSGSALYPIPSKVIHCWIVQLLNKPDKMVVKRSIVVTVQSNPNNYHIKIGHNFIGNNLAFHDDLQERT